MPISRAGNSTESGFTLVELAVVLVLVGLLLGLVLPRLPGIGEDRLEATARHIAGMTRHIYNEAALTGQEHLIRFDLTGQRIEGLRREVNGELIPLTGNGRGSKLPDSVRFVDVELLGLNTVTSGQLDVRVLPIGWIDETVIRLRGDNEQILTLHLQPLTGMTQIQVDDKNR
jgi:general secretion pathway protein H